jgi:hypothetical protein
MLNQENGIHMSYTFGKFWMQFRTDHLQNYMVCTYIEHKVNAVSTLSFTTCDSELTTFSAHGVQISSNTMSFNHCAFLYVDMLWICIYSSKLWYVSRLSNQQKIYMCFINNIIFLYHIKMHVLI